MDYITHAKDAREFLEILITGSGVFSAPTAAAGARWAYRGQADADWPLIASVLRTNAPSKLTHRARVMAELRDVTRFFHRADEAGIDLPENSQPLRQFLEQFEQMQGMKAALLWPPPELFSLLALAQHYRIKTRLLDWTMKPLVAAYFAAKDACIQRAQNKRVDPASKKLIVYGAIVAIRDEWITRQQASAETHFVEVVRAPHSGNPNLHAQAGIFTVVRPVLQWDSLEVPLPLNTATNFHVSGLSLSWEQAPSLLYLLAQAGVSAAAIFPGFGGVVESLEEEKYWPKEFLYARPIHHSDFWTTAGEPYE